MAKVYGGKKRHAKHKPDEFPEEPVKDPLIDEATACVASMMAGRKIDGTVTENIGPEQYYGNIEYKLTLYGKDVPRMKRLKTQMNFRLNEGNGQAIYKIGVEDNGNPRGINDEHLNGSLSKLSHASVCVIATLYMMAKSQDANMIIEKLYNGQSGKIVFVLFQKRLLEMQKLDVRVILLGGTSVGKSTLVSYLISTTYRWGCLSAGKTTTAPASPAATLLSTSTRNTPASPRQLTSRYDVPRRQCAW